jgi:hypothetical protein
MTEKANTWWILYPFRGLDIADEQHDVINPAFGDFTIIAKKHIRQIIPLLNFTDDPVHGKQNEQDVIYMVENATLREDFHSFIAVRRKGIINKEELVPEIEKNTRVRAYQIASLFTILFLAESSSGGTCGLVEQIHKQIQSTVMLDISNKGFRFQIGSLYPLIIRPLPKAITLSIDELNLILHKPQYIHLTSILLPQRQKLPMSVSRAIMQAAIRLSDAIHSITPSAQLLGAVTSIEILLANQTEKYETLSNRLSALLGTESLIQHDVETVLQARHLYVHQGQEVEEYKTPVKAVGLALNSLLRYAEVAPFFRDKEKLINYLDFVHSGEKLSMQWDETEQDSFRNLQKHERQAVTMPFNESLLRALLKKP